MVDNSQLNERTSFDNAIVMLIRANFKINTGEDLPNTPEGVKKFNELRAKLNLDEITQGYLWTEATLKPTIQTIQWPMVDTQQITNSPITPTMRLLTMQDSFLVSTLSYFLMIYEMTGGNQSNIDFTTGDHWAPITYSATWQNNGSGIAIDAGCDMFWIGSYISIEVNKRMLVPYWDCYKHYKAPSMQAVTGQFVPNILTNFQSAHDGSTDGFYPVQPNIVVGGGRGNVWKLNLAANIPAGIAPFSDSGYGETHVLKAVICTRGILMQNSTTVK